MFEVVVGKEGLEESWQADFPETTKCVHCGGVARHGFTAIETYKEGDTFVCNLHKNLEDGKYWVHDCVAVSVYFCEKCLNTSSLYNQA